MRGFVNFDLRENHRQIMRILDEMSSKTWKDPEMVSWIARARENELRFGEFLDVLDARISAGRAE